MSNYKDYFKIKTFNLQKVVGNKLCDREIIIQYTKETGKMLCVNSKQGGCCNSNALKQKNIFPLFLHNPIEEKRINVNSKSYLAAIIKRENEKPIQLVSHNDLLTELFIKEVSEWINKGLLLKEYLTKWSNCIHNSLMRCVYLIQTKKRNKDIERLQITNFDKELNKQLKQRCKLSIRYLNNYLEDHKFLKIKKQKKK